MCVMERESKRVVVSPEYVRKGSPPPFLMKTYMMVEDPATDAVISWNTDGTAFVVWQPAEFSRDLLPTLFKHCNFSSFVRQLNTYGFNKIATNRWEFSNSKFRKGERDQLREIRRRKASSNDKPQRDVQLQLVAPPPPPPPGDQLSDDDIDEMSLSTSSSSELTILADENKRLQRENSALNSELAAMKEKCKELLDLAAVYSEKGVEDNSNEGTKLFGVDIGR